MAVNFFISEVVSNKKLNHKFRLLEFKIQGGKKFSFQSGQFVLIKVAPTTLRSYSIASHSSKLPYWRLLLDVTPNGPGSIFLKNIKPGQKINHSKAAGVFTLKPNFSTSNILAATGCGLASIIPMAEELIKKDKNNVYLIWGLRYQKDICLLNWLKTLEGYPKFKYQITLSQPGNSWIGEKGHLVSPLLKLVQNLPKDDLNIYLCGNQKMISDINNALGEMNFSKDKIHFERHY